MTPVNSDDGLGNVDVMVDEVRSIRASISREYGDDVDRLCDHLAEVGEDFRERRGIFSSISPSAMQRLVESWGADAQRSDDPLIDEVRRIRSGLHN